MTTKTFDPQRVPLGLIETIALSINRGQALQLGNVKNHVDMYHFGLQLLARTNGTGGKDFDKFLEYFSSQFGHTSNYQELLWISQLSKLDDPSFSSKHSEILEKITKTLGFAKSKSGLTWYDNSAHKHVVNHNLWKPSPPPYRKGWKYPPNYPDPRTSNPVSSVLDPIKYGFEVNPDAGEFPKLFLDLIQGNPSVIQPYGSKHNTNPLGHFKFPASLNLISKHFEKLSSSNFHQQLIYKHVSDIRINRLKLVKNSLDFILASCQKNYIDRVKSAESRRDNDFKSYKQKYDSDWAASSLANRLNVKSAYDTRVRQRKTAHENELDRIFTQRWNDQVSGFNSFFNQFSRYMTVEECQQLIANPSYKWICLNSLHFMTNYLNKFCPDILFNGQQLEKELAYYSSIAEMVSNKEWSKPTKEQVPSSYFNFKVIARLCKFNAILRLWKTRGELARSEILAYIKTPCYGSWCNPNARVGQECIDIPSSSSYPRPYNIQTYYHNNEQEVISAFLLDHFTQESIKDPKEFLPYIENQFCLNIFVTAKVSAARDDPNQWLHWLNYNKGKTDSKIDETSFLSRLQNNKSFSFIDNNIKYYGTNDPVALTMKLQQTGTILIKIFEINTEAYYKEKKSQITTDIELDGLTPNWEQVYQFPQTPHKLEIKTFTFTQLEHRAGVFVIEFIAAGQSCRAVIVKGQHRFTTRTHFAGHAFRLYNESNQACPDAYIWMDGSEYKVDSTGDIIIPYTHTDRPNRSFIIVDKSFCSLQSFTHKCENYSLECAFSVDREQFISNNEAIVVVRPVLYNNNQRCSLKPLEKPQLVYKSTDKDGINDTKTVDLDLKDDDHFTFKFRVPEEISSIYFTFTATIQQGDKPLTLSKSWSNSTLNQSSKSMIFFYPHLLHTENGKVIQLLGRSGEPIPHFTVSLTITHKYLQSNLSLSISSDADGKIHLGHLYGASSINISYSCYHGGSVSKRFELKNINSVASHVETLLHTTIVNNTNETNIQIPYISSHPISGQGIVECPASDAVCYSIHPQLGHVLTDCSNKLVLDSDRAVINVVGIIEPGLFQIKMSDKVIQLHVADETCSSNPSTKDPHFFLSENKFFQKSTPQPIHPASISFDTHETDSFVKIQLSASTLSTRVFCIATTFDPLFEASKPYFTATPPQPGTITCSTPEARFLNGRKLGEEYRYILDRKFAGARTGNMNPQPSLHINAWSREKTETSTQTAQKGGNYSSASLGGGIGSFGGSRSSVSITSVSDIANIDFLKHPSLFLTNLKVDNETHSVSVQIPQNRYTFLQVISIDKLQVGSLNTVIPGTHIQSETHFKSMALSPEAALDPAQHFVEVRATRPIYPKSVLPVPGSLGLYDKVKTAFKLFNTLSSTSNLSDFMEFLSDWTDLDMNQKNEKYSQYASHELNFFLYRKDPEYFTTVIRPHLVNKYSKQVIDYWLLGDYLTVASYFNFGTWKTYNLLEKLLIFDACQSTGEPGPDLVRIWEDEFDITKNSVFSQQDRLFQTALRTATAIEDPRPKSKKGQDEKKQNRQQQQQQPTQPSLQMFMAQPPPPISNEIMFDLAPSAPLSISSSLSESRGGRMSEKMEEASFSKQSVPMLRKSKKKKSKPSPSRSRRMAAPCPPPAAAAPSPAPAAARRGAPRPMPSTRPGGSAPPPSDSIAQLMKIKSSQNQFKPLPKTEEWAESQWYKIRNENVDAVSRLMTLNPFWIDCAKAIKQDPHIIKDPSKPFLPTSFIFSGQNSFSEQMACLALITLRFTNTVNLVPTGGRLEISATDESIAFYKDLIHCSTTAENPDNVKIEQYYFDPKYPTFTNQDTNETKPLKLIKRFQPNRIYGCKVVISKPSSSTIFYDLLLQCPQNAIPLYNGFHTKNRPLSVSTSNSIDYYFYFPSPGTFKHFPVHVSQNNKLIAFSEASVLTVNNHPERWPLPPPQPPLPEPDTTSWNYISQKGTLNQVFEYLDNHPFHSVNLDLICFKCKDSKDSYLEITNYLRKNLFFHENIFAYAFYHKDRLGIKDWCQDTYRARRSSGFSQHIKTWCPSSFHPRDAVKDKKYEHLEYLPLINSRSHTLGQQRKILNSKFRQQYSAFISNCIYSPFLDANQLMAATFYLLIQDRTEDAIALFNRIAELPESSEACLPRDFPGVGSNGLPAFSSDAKQSEKLLAEIVSQGKDNIRLALGPKANPKSPRYFESQMQYDYLAAFLDFYNPEYTKTKSPPAKASALCNKYRNYPVTKWRDRWNEMLSQCEEIHSFSIKNSLKTDVVVSNIESFEKSGTTVDHANLVAATQQTANKSIKTSPTFDVRLVDTTMKIDYKNIQSLEFRYYKMDLELLFSTNPFMFQKLSTGNSMFIMPNLVHTVQLPANQTVLDVSIPQSVSKDNLMIEVLGEGMRKTLSFYSNSIRVEINKMGTLQVLDRESNFPVSRAYVKVYAQDNSNKDHFWLDTYTDLRGRANYCLTSDSKIPIEVVSRFAILIMTESNGSLLKEATPPKQ